MRLIEKIRRIVFFYLLKGHVGAGVELTRGCVIGSLCSITCPQVVSENTVIYGDELHRRNQSEKPAVSFAFNFHCSYI